MSRSISRPRPSAATCLALLLGLALLTACAWAGPPLVTDDPVPSTWRHWEIVTPLVLESAAGDDQVQLPGLDLNYGGRKNLQLTLGTAVVWEGAFRPDSRFAADGVELAAKYRFATFGREDHQTQLAIFPRAIIPQKATPRRAARLADYEWPIVWLRGLGERTRLYGDVHVTTMHESHMSPWFVGGAFERDANKRLTLTGELYWQGAEERGADAVTAFSVGFLYTAIPSAADQDSGIDLLFAVGRSLTLAPNATVYIGPRFRFRG